ncbi:uncharacterized protein LOC110454667 [Mizuhopecten yessoensis]|uniref:BZIP domain-containing protein n=1 Tax=Mizuhopecten yessoensis TaxID=6573 RepID=A0A210QF32_MIZYE|nr:uncharacterized protein LOC110454667 [Mizuhopecten yessoensis]OWF47231.1 hypothetical protein KP79_PYT10638 [Mizuhopecten yessoensis]
MAVNLTEVDPSDEEECKLAEAALACYESGCLTPLIKEELKYKIHTRRMEQGKGELQVQFTAPDRSELTAEEVLKSDRRRQQNRQAARTFRERKTTSAATMNNTLQKLQTDNARLNADIERLVMEKEFWQGKLNTLLLSTIEGYLDS